MHVNIEDAGAASEHVFIIVKPARFIFQNQNLPSYLQAAQQTYLRLVKRVILLVF